MIFQLTTAGRSLINTEGLALEVTKVEFGNAYNYVPSNEPTGLTGSEVYETQAVFSPVAVDANTLRFTVYLPEGVTAFTFGEMAMYSGSTLIGVGASVVQIVKATDAHYRMDVFVDLLGSQRFASWEVVSSFTRNFFPRIPSPDVLPPPAFDTNNVYVIYGDGDYKSAYLAFSDISGSWSFSNKSRTWFTGTIDAIGANGIESSDLDNAEYYGSPTDLVIQFIDGTQRGVCRRLNTLQSGEAGWSTQLIQLPAVGDEFVILGPYIGDQFNGDHDTLNGLQGGQSGQHYHLTLAQRDRVEEPRFKTVKTVSTSTYSVVDADNDAFITLTNSTVTVTLNDAAFTTFPVGGHVFFRYLENVDVTIQRGGSTTIYPYNTISIPAGGNGTFALLKKASGSWDYMASVAEEETFDGNVRHKFPDDGGSLAPESFVPMYAAGGDEDGPIADITTSKLTLSSSGNLRMWPGAVVSAPVWSTPAIILVGVSSMGSGSTFTGLANDSTAYTLTGTVNGLPFSISILGSAAQTYTNLVAQFNIQLWADLGSNSIASLSLNGYGVIFATDDGGDDQNITLTTTNLFDSLVNLVPNYRRIHTGSTVGVDPASTYLNQYDSATNNNRLFRTGFGAFVTGLQNAASGLSGYAVGGAYNFAAGNYSGIIGGSTNRVFGFYSQIYGGYGNVIQPHSSNLTYIPQFVTMQNTERSLIETKSTSTGVNDVPVFVNINSTRRATVRGSYVTVQTCQQVTASGLYGNVMGSQTVTIVGDYINIFGSNNVAAGSGSNNVTVSSSEDINVTGSHVAVLGVKELTTSQSSVLYFPNGATNVAGKPGLTFTISSSAYGNTATLPLTTDGDVLTDSNRMVVPTGEAWSVHATVVVNYPAGFKSWIVKAALKNVAGTVNVVYVEVESVGSINASYMTVDLVAGTGGNTGKVHFVVVPRNDANSGYQQVSCSAMATITAARALT